MAKSKKQITPVETVPDFSISLFKKGMSITVSKTGDKLTVDSTPLSGIDNIHDLGVYQDLLGSAIDEYFEHSMDCDLNSDEVNNDDLVPCQCRKIV